MNNKNNIPENQENNNLQEVEQDNNQNNNQDIKPEEEQNVIHQGEITEEDLAELLRSIAEDPEEFNKKLNALLNDPDKLDEVSGETVEVGNKKIKIITNYNSKNKSSLRSIINLIVDFMLMVIFYVGFSFVFKTFDNNDIMNFAIFTGAYSLLSVLLIFIFKKKMTIIYAMFGIFIDVIATFVVYLLLYILFNKLIPGTFVVNFGILAIVFVLSLACTMVVNRYFRRRLIRWFYRNKKDNTDNNTDNNIDNNTDNNQEENK